MKKIMTLGLSAALLLAACGNEESTESASNAETTETGPENIKSDLMQFYLSVSKTINQEDTQLNEFEIAQTEETLPAGDELATLKESAATSAEQAKQAIEEIEIPSPLDDYNEQIDQALASMTESYDMKIEELNNEAPDFQAAIEKFGEADTAFNEILEENGLVPSNLYNEVSQ